MQKYWVVGNWKMGMHLQKAISFFKGVKAPKKVQVAIAAPSTLIYPLAQLKRKEVFLGSQNIHCCPDGAFTGEVSAQMVKEVGGQFTIIGHSERRILFNETDETISKKICMAIQSKLKVILCVGEPLEVKAKGQGKRYITTQIEKALKTVDQELLAGNLMVAYEPVWSIGAKDSACSEWIADMHQHIAKVLSKKGLNGTPILYGGAVNASNVKNILNIPHVNGVLVGRAALELESFSEIINSIG